MMTRWAEWWQHLSATPLFGLTLTLVAYQAGFWVFRRSGYKLWLHPVLLAIVTVAPFLLAVGVSYEAYFAGAQFVHFLLGPATVALAIPLYQQIQRVRAMWGPILVGLCLGSLTAMVSAVGLARWLGAGVQTQLSLAPKSVTTPIAMALAEQIGGVPSLAAVIVILTGMLGALCAPYVFALMRLHDPAIRGFAIGVAAHGVGTARAFQVSEQSGAFAALAMGLNGAFTALVLPLLVGGLK